MNLLKETQEKMAQHSLSPCDVVFVGSASGTHACSWCEFFILADVDYDAGFGAQEVASDLIIVFINGGRFVRREYDGSEGWEYIPPFVMPTASRPLATVLCPEDLVGWRTVAEIHEYEEA